ncbi:alpha/beta family hydrolase [uncultured Paraglaciecola sp.]|uniref:alpha/beta family hydrolase n=1 Tax=uncultured Paraglaciecola sp. TaxID=1765024 RepID=UPI002618DC0E|nr:alpha/beta family hydrolase [uncultured Paraglaciecola sp.]
MTQTLINIAPQPIANFVFAHGAGAGQESEFMNVMAQGIAKHNITVIRFNFPYMQLAQQLGKRRPPDRADKLLTHFTGVLDELDKKLPIFIGGKSMGGRMASMLLQDSIAKGCICMGYPFHPPAKPEKLRTGDLLTINKPVLILQGERDTFGTRAEIDTYSLSQQVQLRYLADGDHSFKPRKASGYSLDDNLTTAIDSTVDFIHSAIKKETAICVK